MFDELFKGIFLTEGVNVTSNEDAMLVTDCKENSTLQISKLRKFLDIDKRDFSHILVAWSPDCSKYLAAPKGEEMKSRIQNFVRKELDPLLFEGQSPFVDWSSPIAWMRMNNQFAFHKRLILVTIL